MTEKERSVFRTDISEHDLTHAIKHFGTKAFEGRQVVRRFHDLLPSQLLELKKKQATRLSASHALRAALVEKKYQELIDQFIAANYETIQARINYETFFMLYQARQSLRKARRLKNTAAQHTKSES